jgi:ATP-dependent Lhr-like helicase
MPRASAGADPLAPFHPLIAAWFRERVGEPTAVQALAWPVIADREHVLVSAPTGSGKTLTAFLWAIHQLLTGAWGAGRLRVLYVSPLRALNNDIHRNLLGPLAELAERFGERGVDATPVRVLTRSGDTPGSERQKMLRQPPEILITTPESLNILLTSTGGRAILGDLECVILDEIHAVAGSKRGTHLITAVERLVRLSGELQRIALSATIRPASRIAGFVGGFQMVARGEAVGYRSRPVRVIRSDERKRYDLEVRVAASAVLPARASTPLEPRGPAERPGPNAATSGAAGAAAAGGSTPWDALAAELTRSIEANRATLLFANSRRTTEKVTRLLNADRPAPLAYSHHGSLSRELRQVVERRLKEGRLAAIVATNSLELGIDIGSLDEVILVQTPPTLASAVQRIGRAGHAVGETSRGRLYPLFGRDLVDAAVVAAGVVRGEIEEVKPVTGALDVLAQVILSMTAVERWDVDELYDFVRSSYPYRDLERRQFDLLLEMLAGRYADSRVRELYPRLSLDRIENTVEARPGTARLVHLCGGTIPDRGYFHLRHEQSMAKLGELDEEFVWERSLGDTFALGAQAWRISRITHNDVLVTPARRAAAMAPFWKAEARDRSFFLSERIACFLERAEAYLDGGETEALRALLAGEHCMAPAAADQLLALLEQQRAATGRALPHRHHLLIEHLSDADSGDEQARVVFHTLWGGRVNRPLAMALRAAWRKTHGLPLQLESENDCLMAVLPRELEASELLELCRADNLETLLRDELESTGFFGARFRENAGRALLLPRSGLRRRVPLWLNRQRAKTLLESVSRYGDFPILLETWRTCLQDEFDLEATRQVLDELAREEIRMTQARTSAPSPFAANLIWSQTNRLMYEDDTPEGGASALRGDLLKELVFSSSLRPEIPAELRERFQRKLHRTFPGYAPRTATELLDWVKERLLLPEAEWRELLAAIDRDARAERDRSRRAPEAVEGVESLLQDLDAKLVRLRRAGSDAPLIVAVETLPRLMAIEALAAESIERLALTADEPPPPEAMQALDRLLAAPACSVADPADAASRGDDPLVELLAEWLRAYGPIEQARVAAAFGMPLDRLDAAIEELVEDERLVIDRFGADGSPLELCDAVNLESLLRLMRAEARPRFEPLPVERLPLYLAVHQRLGTSGAGLRDLERALETLFGVSAPAALWESDLLPARLDPYYPSWLDSLLQESDLVWIGVGRERLTFLFPADLELLGPDGPDGAIDAQGAIGAESELLPDPRARFAFAELVERSGLDTGALSARLWDEVWRGAITNTGFQAVRTGALNRFRPIEDRPAPPRPGAARGAAARGGRSARRGFERWRASRPFAGDWHRLPARQRAEDLDALDLEELNKDRVRLLLDRYGILFRELLLRELPALQWAPLFRSLRLMELSGEVLAGQFFDGIPGLQFASPAAYRRLREGLPEDLVYWMNAVDPASPCGLGLDALRGEFPRRVPSSHLVFHGSRLVVASQRNAAELEIRVGPEHPGLPDYLRFIKVLLTREFSPLRVVEVETVNGDPAPTSPWAAAIAAPFTATRDHRSLKLRRRY